MFVYFVRKVFFVRQTHDYFSPCSVVLQTLRKCRKWPLWLSVNLLTEVWEGRHWHSPVKTLFGCCWVSKGSSKRKPSPCCLLVSCYLTVQMPWQDNRGVVRGGSSSKGVWSLGEWAGLLKARFHSCRWWPACFGAAPAATAITAQGLTVMEDPSSITASLLDRCVWVSYSLLFLLEPCNKSKFLKEPNEQWLAKNIINSDATVCVFSVARPTVGVQPGHGWLQDHVSKHGPRGDWVCPACQ